MHLKYFDLREAVKNYFCNGDKSPYSWLNQLLKKMLGYNLVVCKGRLLKQKKPD